MLNKSSDSTLKGVILGLLMPLVIMAAIILYSSSRFESVKDTLDHFQTFGLLYRILSISLMPGAGLFLIWTRLNKINQARGILLITMFYGVFVIMLYLK